MAATKYVVQLKRDWNEMGIRAKGKEGRGCAEAA